MLENAFRSLNDDDYELAMKRVRDLLNVDPEVEAMKPSTLDVLWATVEAFNQVRRGSVFAFGLLCGACDVPVCLGTEPKPSLPSNVVMVLFFDYRVFARVYNDQVQSKERAGFLARIDAAVVLGQLN